MYLLRRYNNWELKCSNFFYLKSRHESSLINKNCLVLYIFIYAETAYIVTIIKINFIILNLKGRVKM